ncbi:hypothetical protein [Sulfitobacter sp. SK012]|uniref:hypothetical protein n=1 Tax=Sulfitobacter sp. SK012 TaxID=1389005 RepID=UPI0013B37915|nr:hypothetical protein [Sulfitobacter sp. SK012]
MIHRQTPPVYKSEGSLIFRFDKEYFPNVVVSNTWKGEPIRLFVDEAIHTEMEILSSRRVLVAAEQSAKTGVAPAALRQNLDIKRIDGTYVVNVSFLDKDPMRATHFVKIMFETYLLERQAILDIDASGALFDAKTRMGEELTRARAAVAAFKEENGFYDYGRQTEALIERQRTLGAAAAGTQPAPGAGRNGWTVAQEIARLEGLNQKLARLELDVEIFETSLRNIAQLAEEAQLSVDLRASRGPAIKILDAPAANPDPVGLSVMVQTILGAVSGGIGIAMLIFLARWVPTLLAPQAAGKPEAEGASEEVLKQDLLEQFEEALLALSKKAKVDHNDLEEPVMARGLDPAGRPS